MSHRFSHVQYDRHAVEQQAKLKEKFEVVESLVNELEDGRAKQLVYTYLEIAYMWTGKAIRDTQIKRTGKVVEQFERNNE